jgi:hypothetical protein
MSRQTTRVKEGDRDRTADHRIVIVVFLAVPVSFFRNYHAYIPEIDQIMGFRQVRFDPPASTCQGGIPMASKSFTRVLAHLMEGGLRERMPAAPDRGI